MAIKPGETHTWSELKRDSDFKNKFFLSAIERGRRQIHTKIRWTNFIVNGERMSQFDFLRKHVIAVVEWDQDFNITRVKRFD